MKNITAKQKEKNNELYRDMKGKKPTTQYNDVIICGHYIAQQKVIENIS